MCFRLAQYIDICTLALSHLHFINHAVAAKGPPQLVELQFDGRTCHLLTSVQHQFSAVNSICVCSSFETQCIVFVFLVLSGCS